MRGLILVYLLSALLLAGCSDHQSRATNASANGETISMSNPVTIKLGESGPDFAKRYSSMVNVVHQPAGLDFYSARWGARPHGVVKLDLGSYSLTLPHVLSLQAAQELGQLAPEGLYEFSINTGITEPELIAHDEARLQTYKILSAILQAGWKPFIERSEPRLSGKARYDYTLSTVSVNGLDPSYLPTLDEWMRIESRTPWSFYAPGAYLELSFTRERTLTDPAKPGSYMLTFNVKTEAEHARGYVESDDRPRWKALLPKILPDLVKARQQKEAELKAKGVAIDETYQDPALPGLSE